MKKRTVPSSAPADKAQFAIRLDRALIDRLDALATQLSRPGLAITRTDAVRIALETGLQTIEKERRR